MYTRQKKKTSVALIKHYPKNKQNMCDMYRDPMSLVPKNKTAITLILKQVCATHN